MTLRGRQSSSLPRRRRRLATRLITGILILLTVILVVFGATTVTATRQDLQTRLDDSVRQTMGRATAYTGFEEVPGRDPLDAPGQPAGALTVVLDNGKATTAAYRTETGEGEALPDGDIALLQAAAEAALHKSEAVDGAAPQQGQLSTVDLSIGQYRIESLPTSPEQDTGKQVLVAGLPTAPVEETIEELILTMVTAGVLALVVTAVGGTVVVRRALRPLEQVSAAAAAVARLPLASGEISLTDQHVPAALAQPGTEVGDVGQALNALLDNVDSALAARHRSQARLRQFVADASHELRTPLAAVRGYTDMLQLTEPLTDQGEAKLTRIEQQTLRMTTLVEDLLLLARLDEGHRTEFHDANLAELVLDALTDASAAGPDHQWSVELPDEPVPVRGDAGQLNQVLANLLSNARKHTPPGTTVTASVRRSDDGWAEATVVDDGPGIPEDFQNKLFERFSRLDISRHTREGSTGLGLSIVRSLIEAHNGTVEVESRPGRTAFTVRLPLHHELLAQDTSTG